MAGKDFTLFSFIIFGALLTNHVALGGLIRPPAVPPFASTLSFYLSPPPAPHLLPASPIVPSALPLPSPTQFNPFVLPPTLPNVLSGLPYLPNAPLLPPPFGVNGLRFFSTKGVFPSLLPAYPPVFPALAPILPPAPLLPPAALPPPLLPAFPAAPALPAPALPAYPPTAPPAFPGFPGFLSTGPLPFAPIKQLYRRDVNTPAKYS